MSRAEDPDDLPKAFLQSLGQLYGATVGAVVLVGADERLSVLTYSGVDHAALRVLLKQMAEADWNTSESR